MRARRGTRSNPLFREVSVTLGFGTTLTMFGQSTAVAAKSTQATCRPALRLTNVARKGGADACLACT